MTMVKGVIKGNSVVLNDDLDSFDGKSVVVTVLDSPETITSKDYNINIVFYNEEDGSCTGFVEELDLVENSDSKEGCLKKLLFAMRDYAKDFCDDYDYWASYNRLAHIPYVLKILSSTDSEIREHLICRDGEN